MSRERMPLIGSCGSKTTAKPPLSTAAPQRPRQANSRKRSQQQTSSTSTYPHTGPASILLSDNTMTPWGGLALSESSFTSIPPPPPPAPPRPTPPPPPPAPQPTPSTPYEGRENKNASSSSFNSEAPSPPVVLPQEHTDGVGRGFRQRRKVLPQRRVPHPPRLPPLRPVTNQRVSRSFTFSFFELPPHQSPHHRAEHIRNLMLLLKQIHY